MNGIILTALAGLMLVLPLTTINDAVNKSRQEDQQRQPQLINRIAEKPYDRGIDHILIDPADERHDRPSEPVHPVDREIPPPFWLALYGNEH